MARRNNRIAIGAGPAWTNVFQADAAGGPDGAVAREVMISCSPGSANPVEYRVEDPADPSGEQATLEPGEVAWIKFSPSATSARVRHVVMRGAGGDATGGVEVIE